MTKQNQSKRNSASKAQTGGRGRGGRGRGRGRGPVVIVRPGSPIRRRRPKTTVVCNIL